MSGDSVVSATPRIPGRRAPVEAGRRLRVHVGGLGAESGKIDRVVHRLDRRETALPLLLRPSRPLGASAKQQKASSWPERQQASGVWTFEAIVRAVVLRGVDAEAIEADFGRVAPAANER